MQGERGIVTLSFFFGGTPTIRFNLGFWLTLTCVFASSVMISFLLALSLDLVWNFGDTGLVNLLATFCDVYDFECFLLLVFSFFDSLTVKVER